MYKCLCGKSFKEKISCSRHQSTCLVYREDYKKRKKIRVYKEEGVDHVICKICGYKARDLSAHFRYARPPHIKLKEYRQMYPDARIACSDVELKRKKTNMKLHGNPNYRNSDAQSAGIRKAMSDPSVIERMRETKQRRYGDPNYVNIEARKKTLMERYGTDNAMKVPEIAKKSRRIFNSLYKDNPVNRTPTVLKEDLIDRHLKKGQTLREIGNDLGHSAEVISYWMKKYGIMVKRKIVSSVVKQHVPPVESVKFYLEMCKQYGKVLSFSDIGKLTENKRCQRLKRLFNKGKPYHHLKEELRKAALREDLWSDFLKEFK